MLENKIQRTLFIDVIRAISIFAVIIIHVSMPLRQSPDINWWLTENFYDSLSRWAVPTMVMVSGALLLNPNKEYTMRTFFNKRVSKVLIPLLFWGIVYTIWKYRTIIIAGKSLPILIIIKSFVIGPIYYHLWFLYMILGLYLSTPILRVYIKNATLDNIKYCLIVWFISTGIVYFIAKNINVKPWIEINFFTGFIGYFILGYYLNKVTFSRKHINAIYIIAFIGFLITIIGTFVLAKHKGIIPLPSYALYNYNGINVILMSIGIFVLIKDINWEKILTGNFRLNKFILEISQLSFGIYLIHVLILEFSRTNLAINVTTFDPIIGIPFVSMMILSASYIIIKLMKKLPIVERFVP